ncbi:hypothetical protein Salat_0454500 [Sesamum alatum]|uniref:Uncharacterized protein n=1 Tax=Sesamum alatum TaxID=300844 RepID=A0AAE1Z456_9LAMI|nr:hypothetical protein Salat_0454500 [Sesamum alatum]
MATHPSDALWNRKKSLNLHFFWPLTDANRGVPERRRRSRCPFGSCNSKKVYFFCLVPWREGAPDYLPRLRNRFPCRCQNALTNSCRSRKLHPWRWRQGLNHAAVKELLCRQGGSFPIPTHMNAKSSPILTLTGDFGVPDFSSQPNNTAESTPPLSSLPTAKKSSKC